MKLNISPEILQIISNHAANSAHWQRLKTETKERVRTEQQCTGANRKGERCRAWSVWGDPGKKCYRHGGAETAKTPRSERMPACVCGAYNFPHRQRSGFCNHPNEPLGHSSTPRGQRKYYKRIRKAQMKRFLAEVGL